MSERLIDGEAIEIQGLQLLINSECAGEGGDGSRIDVVPQPKLRCVPGIPHRRLVAQSAELPGLNQQNVGVFRQSVQPDCYPVHTAEEVCPVLPAKVKARR